MIRNSLFLLPLVVSIQCSSLAGPADTLRAYFEAVDTRDKKRLAGTIYAPDDYKESFVKVIDVITRLAYLGNLLSEKYKIPESQQFDYRRYIFSLNKDLEKREFSIEGDHAYSIPLEEGEVSVHFIRKNDVWLIDFWKGQSKREISKQAVLLGKNYDAISTVVNRLINKIDSLDVKKYTYEDAWTMVAIQIEKKMKEN